MKKLVLALAFVFCAALSAQAAQGGFSGPGAGAGGFTGPGSASQVSTVAQALNMPDDTYVTLEGYVVERLPREERYTFKDDTGTMVVEIDHKVFMGQEITPQTRVRILGEVDTSMRRANEIDVKQLSIVK